MSLAPMANLNCFWKSGSIRTGSLIKGLVWLPWQPDQNKYCLTQLGIMFYNMVYNTYLLIIWKNYVKRSPNIGWFWLKTLLKNILSMIHAWKSTERNFHSYDFSVYRPQNIGTSSSWAWFLSYFSLENFIFSSVTVGLQHICKAKWKAKIYPIVTSWTRPAIRVDIFQLELFSTDVQYYSCD